jgi:hypothetical protein
MFCFSFTLRMPDYMQRPCQRFFGWPDPRKPASNQEMVAF